MDTAAAGLSMARMPSVCVCGRGSLMALERATLRRELQLWWLAASVGYYVPCKTMWTVAHCCGLSIAAAYLQGWAC